MNIIKRIKLIRFVLMLRRHENIKFDGFFTCLRISSYLSRELGIKGKSNKNMSGYYWSLYPKCTKDGGVIKSDNEDFKGFKFLRRKYLLKLAIHLALFKVG